MIARLIHWSIGNRLLVLIATFGLLAFDRLPTAAAMGAAVGVLLLTNVVDRNEEDQ